ncbi:hypothetical protein Ana3638_18805 [Anaerocolumna sedimenticola]|uniref:Uncharacterized protein n=1 Tax=Anaerocolumna sedimenticola TaxID=2696063 RepID=A0A6P1TS52_9FIRM|nr:hypothetical protein [Anaerocolumna sedimenticola]QHQ62576.1 hypothetical protein Ana3638_18805 [Anaerocolumna sedimenticola]
MTTEKIITLAKEKLGKEITEQEAQDYLNGKIALPDEALDIVSGGGKCNLSPKCPKCGAECIRVAYHEDERTYVCPGCKDRFRA